MAVIGKTSNNVEQYCFAIQMPDTMIVWNLVHNLVNGPIRVIQMFVIQNPTILGKIHRSLSSIIRECCVAEMPKAQCLCEEG